MAIYAVYAPRGETDPQSLVERAHVERQGFTFLGLVFGPAWLLARGLWRPFGLWLVAAIVVGLAVRHGFLASSAAPDLYALSALFIGFEGRTMRQAALARRGFPLADVAVGDDRDAAERDFAARALAARSAPAPASAAASGRYSPHADDGHGIIGLFPETGR
jgi:hypothetical protein